MIITQPCFAMDKQSLRLDPATTAPGQRHMRSHRSPFRTGCAVPVMTAQAAPASSSQGKCLTWLPRSLVLYNSSFRPGL